MLIENLTLETKERVIDNIELFEPVDIEVLDKLLNSDLLRTDAWSVDSYYTTEQTEREQLENYKKIVKNGKAVVKYNRIKEIGLGRVYPLKELGLATIRRQIRHTLVGHLMVDLDVVNCHPVLLLQICKRHIKDKEKYKNLEKYVINRDEIINELIEEYKTDRDTIKQLFIIIIYFGSFNKWTEKNNLDVEPTKFINKFIKEISEIAKMIYDNNKQLSDLIKKRKTEQKKQNKNKLGSLLSYFLQEIECEILETVYNYCIRNKIIENKEAVLCYDGIMINKDKFNNQLCSKFSEIVLKKTGFDVKFIKKEMNEGYLNILDEHQLKEEDKIKQILTDYEILKMNDEKLFTEKRLTLFFEEDITSLGGDKYIKYFHLTNSFRYFNKFHGEFYLSSSIWKLEKFKLEEYSKFNESFKHLYFEHEKKEIKFTTLYEKCKYKNIYSGVDFEPNKKEIDEKYNLFRGFKYDNFKEGYNKETVDIFINHIKFLTKDEPEVYKYVINWFSHILQKPEKKTKVCIVLYSIIEGIGKNILLDIFGALLKNYTAKFIRTSSICDKFQGDLVGKLFVVGDEIKGGVKDVADELKDLITRMTESAEFKGKDKKHDINDYKNYAFTTNNENVFKISKSDRRYVMIEAPEELKDEKYFKKLFEILDNDDKLADIHNYLKSVDITTFEPNKIPMTDYKKNMIINNLPSYIKFIKDEAELYEGETIKTSDLYKKSLDFGKRNKLNVSYSEVMFCKNFKRVFGSFNTQDPKTRTSVYVFPSNLSEDINELINKNYL